MSRCIKVAAGQLGPNNLTTSREEVLDRMIALLRTASEAEVQIVIFPETAFTTFFPRHLFQGAELESFFEKAGPDDDITKSPAVKPLFDAAYEMRIDICVGYAEQVTEKERYNSAVYYSARDGRVLAKYRKVHLPGTFEPFTEAGATQQLEKRYFRPGNLGFKAFRVPGLMDRAAKSSTIDPLKRGNGDPIMGMLVCNDRRWPEAWRSYGLQGVEVILCGYNSTGYAPQLIGNKRNLTPEQFEADALFHNNLVLQSNSYMNACFSINAAKAGMEDGKYNLIGGSCIVDPEGHIVAAAKTKGDELVVAEIDLDECRSGKEKTFDFDRHRRIEHYGLLSSQTGVVEPPFLD